jgi:hypothetical protein
LPEPVECLCSGYAVQCECGLPVPHMPQELGTPLQLASTLWPATLEAKTDSFFSNFGEPQ